jgi:DNA-binding XRE family transcriptional regulator
MSRFHKNSSILSQKSCCVERVLMSDYKRPGLKKIYTDLEEKFQALREIRLAAGWTQAMVAEHVGVDRTEVGKWESNVRKPAYEKIVILTRLLDVLQQKAIEDGNGPQSP